MTEIERKSVLAIIFIICTVTQCNTQCPEKCFCSKDLTSVNCEGQGFTTIPAGIPYEVDKLYLDNNLIPVILPYSFRNLTKLRYIQIRANHITAIETDGFSDLPVLSELYLSGNMISLISPNAFNNTININVLNLSGNKLTSIPSLGQIINLQELVLEGNSFSTVIFPQAYENLRNLGLISLSNSGISVLNETSFVALRNSGVRKLEISRNKIYNVSGKAFQPLQAMESLKIGRNPLDATALEIALQGLNRQCLRSLNIAELSLNGNLPSTTFSLLTNSTLTTLMMPNNKIRVLPSKGFIELSDLVTLSLSGSSIQNIPSDAFIGLNNLKILFLDGNQISDVPMNLPHSLNKLYLNGNQIITLHTNAFAGLSNLLELYLGLNHIRSIERDAFNGLYKLTKLHLVNNEINALPASLFASVPAMRSLELNKNNIKTIPAEPDLFSPMLSLQYLNIADNQLSLMPLRIFSKLSSLLYLHMENNDFGGLIGGDYTGSLFYGLDNLLELYLSNNGINNLPEASFRRLVKVKVLRLNQNYISGWQLNTFKTNKFLRTFDLSYNLLAHINSTSFRDLVSLRELNLTGNPFACNCNLRWFRDWLNTTKVNVTDNATYKCNSPASWRGQLLLSFDKTKIDCTVYTLYEIIGSLCVGMIVVSLIVAVIYRKRWFLRFRVYKILQRKTHNYQGGYVPVEGVDKKYTAYISTDEADNQWVIDHLLPDVDDGFVNEDRFGGEYKLYFDHRDADAQKSVVANIVENVDFSHKVLIILSTNYIASALCQFELDYILNAKYGDVISDFLVIKCGNVPVNRIPKCLRMYLEKGTFVEWEEDENAVLVFKDRIKRWLGKETDAVPQAINV